MDAGLHPVEFVLATPVDNVGSACAQVVQPAALSRTTSMWLWTPVEHSFPAPQVPHIPDPGADLRFPVVPHSVHRPYYYDHPSISPLVSVETLGTEPHPHDPPDEPMLAPARRQQP